jgi:hypothetical protein
MNEIQDYSSYPSVTSRKVMEKQKFLPQKPWMSKQEDT